MCAALVEVERRNGQCREEARSARRVKMLTLHESAPSCPRRITWPEMRHELEATAVESMEAQVVVH